MSSDAKNKPAPLQTQMSKKNDVNASPTKHSMGGGGDSPGTAKPQFGPEVMENKKQIDDQIAQLDDKLNLVLAK